MQLSSLLLNQWIGLLPARYWKWTKRPYFYEVAFTGANVAVGSATTNVALQVNSDSDFAWYLTTRTVFATDDTTVIPAPYHTITIVDAGSGYQFMSAAVHLESFAGTAQAPYVFVKPVLLGGGSTLTVSITALAATNRNIRLTLHGLKLYEMAETKY